jgi:hypothetical protein
MTVLDTAGGQVHPVTIHREQEIRPTLFELCDGEPWTVGRTREPESHVNHLYVGPGQRIRLLPDEPREFRRPVSERRRVVGHLHILPSRCARYRHFGAFIRHTSAMVFRFLIMEALPRLEGFEGVVLAGERLDGSSDLAVGDSLQVATADDVWTVRCTGFPLINWGDRGSNWGSFTVAGLPEDVIVVGGTATAVHRP